ncbi:hypothetical protein G7046_g6387 [Stylonectria norvegica]|nr:hypothetical protein G7046_g6387 [Stylonectria norvegica]
MAESAEQTLPVVEQAVEQAVEQTEQDEVTPSAVDDDIKSKKVTLADLSAKGATLYAQRNYEDAAEIFSKASILQAEINGETSSENAEILFHYGRSLFKVGQSKSDVLGGPAATEKQKPANGSAKPKKTVQTEAQKVTQEGVAIVADQKEGEKKVDVDAKKPLFQFTGDENFDESDDDEVAEGEDGDEEEEDDLANAFEILDLARVCYLKKLMDLDTDEQKEEGKEVTEENSPIIRHVKERLADTHDALAEISLENERYPNAIEDGRVSLKYKLDLYPEESEIIAEAHYKLSLALEFASVTTADDEDGATAKRQEMDQSLRDEAVKEMELAIKSSNLKLQTKEVDLATMASPEDNDMARKAISEMKELIADMEQRLVDLRNDPIDAKDILGAETNPFGGILGAALGESAAEKEARVEEAKKTATDLTGLVRKKNKDATPVEAETNGKRKAEDATEEVDAKKAKVEE